MRRLVILSLFGDQRSGFWQIEKDDVMGDGLVEGLPLRENLHALFANQYKRARGEGEQAGE